MNVPERIGAFRRIGFFRGEAGAAAAAGALRRYGDSGSDFSPESLNLLLLAEDRARVYYADLECDAWEGENQFAEWARDISALGDRRPVAATERWLPGNLGDARVEVVMRSRLRSVRVLATDLGDYVDLTALLEGLDRLRPLSLRRLVQADTGSQDACVLLLTPRERRALEKLGIRFLPDARERRLERFRERVRAWWDEFVSPFKARL